MPAFAVYLAICNTVKTRIRRLQNSLNFLIKARIIKLKECSILKGKTTRFLKIIFWKVIVIEKCWNSYYFKTMYIEERYIWYNGKTPITLPSGILSSFNSLTGTFTLKSKFSEFCAVLFSLHHPLVRQWWQILICSVFLMEIRYAISFNSNELFSQNRNFSC